jgi:hypothetical protein
VKTASLTRKTAAGLALILVLAAAMRLLLSQYAPAFILAHDTEDFFGAGYNLARGAGFDLPWKRAPLYAGFLGAAIAALGPSLERIVAIQHVLGLVTVFGRGVGLLAALGTGVNGGLPLMEQTVASEAIYTPLLIGAVLAFLLAMRSGRFSLFLLGGLLFGLGALARPITQAAIPLVVGAILLQPRAWRPRLFAVALVVVGYLLVTGPWLLRNRMEFGAAAISGGMGDSLFARTNRHDREFEFVDQAPRASDPQANRIRRRIFQLAEKNSSGSTVRAYLMREFGIGEQASDAALRDASLQVIRQDPGRYVQGTLSMFATLSLNFANALDPLWESRAKARYAQAWPDHIQFVMEPVVERPRESRVIVDHLTIFYQDRKMPAVIAALFLVGAVCCLPDGRRRGVWILPLLVLSQLLLYAAINGYAAGDGLQSRYRYPLQPLITLISAGGLVVLLAQVRARAWPRLRLLGLALRPTGQASADGPAVSRQA